MLNLIIGVILGVISQVINLFVIDIPWWIWLQLIFFGMLWYIMRDKRRKDDDQQRSSQT